MAKKALLTIDGVHRKVKNGFLTVDSVHHKVKKAYLTVGGVYRPCFGGGGGTLEYYGAVDVTAGPYVYDAGLGGGASANSKYAIFRMPYNPASEEYIATTEAAVDENLTFVAPRNSISNYADTKFGVAATAGDKVIFAHGMGLYYDEYLGYWAEAPYYMCGYDASLTLTGNYGSENQGDGVAAASFGGHAWFAGGQIHGWQWDYDNDEEYEFLEYNHHVYAYNASFTQKMYNTALGQGLAYVASAASAHNVMFMGGQSYNNEYGTNSGVAFKGDSFTMVNPSAMSVRRHSHAAAGVGEYILFVGGSGSTSNAGYKTVDIYNKSLTRTVGTDLPEGRECMLATSFGDYAIFAGGVSNQVSKEDAYAYDTSLTRTEYKMSKNVNGARGNLLGPEFSPNSGCAAIGNFALFGPVYTHGTGSNTTYGFEAFTIA